MGWVSKAALWQETKLRILELVMVGSLALIVPIAAHSASPGSNTGQTMTGLAHSGLMQVGDGHASNWSPSPAGGGGGWHPQHWGPSRFNGGRYSGAGVPAIFDDPFPDWRGPIGGWGNP
jgi:hypothetical protein